MEKHFHPLADCGNAGCFAVQSNARCQIHSGTEFYVGYMDLLCINAAGRPKHAFYHNVFNAVCKVFQRSEPDFQDLVAKSENDIVTGRLVRSNKDGLIDILFSFDGREGYFSTGTAARAARRPVKSGEDGVSISETVSLHSS